MIKTFALLAAYVICAVCSARADYAVIGKGTWPQTWPRELEPLRKQSSTFEGPLGPQQHYAIHFAKREEFESAWPHILKVKSTGTGIRLVRAPNFFLGRSTKAGVVIHGPTTSKADKRTDTTYIELVVDGDVVNLNRIPLPADTTIVDERFKGLER